MIESTGLPTYVAGARLLPELSSPRIVSLHGSVQLSVSETSSVQLRRALRYADEAQARVAATSLAERIEVARLVLREYAEHADQVCWALAHFRGITPADSRWMCQVNLRWSADFESLVELMWGTFMARDRPASTPQRDLQHWCSRGQAALFASSTMDGPPALVAICHAILSGTHLIFKPSFRDAATHLAFDTLYEHGCAHFAQLVRWRSEAPEAEQLNRQLVQHVAQAVIFSSNETYRAVLDSAAAPATPEWDALRDRVKRYGTGLPLAIVTPDADLDQAARDLVEGARLGAGRFCLSACPVLVDRRCHDALLERVIFHARRLRPGLPLDEERELSAHDAADTVAMRAVIHSFGGRLAFGEIRDSDMDLTVLAEVPHGTPALHREFPGTALALIPVDDLTQALSLAVSALRRNLREAWTAIVLFGSETELARLPARVPSFRYLRGGVVARVKLQLPHQGAYFALDLMRRVTVE